MSDFCEMAQNLRMREARSLPLGYPAYVIDNGGRRLGYERREFAYSHYFPERRIGNDRRIRPERRADAIPLPEHKLVWPRS